MPAEPDYEVLEPAAPDYEVLEPEQPKAPSLLARLLSGAGKGAVAQLGAPSPGTDFPPGQAPSPAELHGTASRFAAGTVNLPYAEHTPTESIPAAIGKEAWNVALSLPEFLGSPEGALTAELGGAAPRAVAGTFGGLMGLQAVQELRQAIRDWPTMTPAQKWALGTRLALTSGGATFLGRQALKRPAAVKPAAPAAQPEVSPDASSIPPSAEIHGPLRPQSVEGEGQVPVKEGGERVQPPEEAGGPLPLTPEPVAEPTPAPAEPEIAGLTLATLTPARLASVKGAARIGLIKQLNQWLQEQDRPRVRGPKDIYRAVSDYLRAQGEKEAEAAAKPTPPSAEPAPAPAAEPALAPAPAAPAEAQPAAAAPILDADAVYDAARKKAGAASAIFRRAAEDYRSRKTGDEEFLAAQKRHKAAMDEFDEAESAFITAKNEAAAAPAAAPAEPAKPAETPPAAASKAQAEVTAVARTEGQRPAKEVKAELVARLEAAVKEAPFNTADYFAGLYVKAARTLSETTAITDRPVEGTRPLDLWLDDPISKHDKTPNRETARGGRFIAEALAKKQVPKVTIEIPGDGTFTVWNTKDSLGWLLDRAKALKTTPTEPAKVRYTGVSKEDKAEAARILANPEPAPETGALSGTLPTPPPIKPKAAGGVRPPATAPSALPPNPATVADSLVTTPLAKQPGPLRLFWRQLSVQSMPLTTAADRLSGESGVRLAAAHHYAYDFGRYLGSKVTEGLKIDSLKFYAWLLEDNLRDIRQSLAADKPLEAAKVGTTIGQEGSAFANEAEYQAFARQPDFNEAIARHREMWEKHKDPIYRTAADLDPETPLAGRGLQSGARINMLLADQLMSVPEMGPVRGVGPAMEPVRQLATKLRKDPFARQAKGTGRYALLPYEQALGQMFAREYPIAAQHEFVNLLIDRGLAKVSKNEFEPELQIHGEPTQSRLLRLKPFQNQWLHVPASLRPEFDRVMGYGKVYDPGAIIRKTGDLLTKASIVGLSEGTTHSSNLLTTLVTSPALSNLWLDSMLKTVGRSDIPFTVSMALYRAFRNSPEEMIALAKIGATKRPYTGAFGFGKVLNVLDRGIRLRLSDIYDGLAERGIVEATETGKREFINQAGQYNQRLQPEFIRFLRQTRVQPFATAAHTFAVLSARKAALGPGVKATSAGNAALLRMDGATAIVGAGVLAATFNYLLGGDAKGVPGAPVGSISWKGDDGKTRWIDLLSILGYGRFFRQSGLQTLIRSKQQGLSTGQAIKGGVHDLAKYPVAMVSGPLPRFIYNTWSGKTMTSPPYQVAPIMLESDADGFNPLRHQTVANFWSAVQKSSAAVDGVVSMAAKFGGEDLDDFLQRNAPALRPTERTWTDILGSQVPRFTPRTSTVSEEMSVAMPRIVNNRDARDFADDLARRARQAPDSAALVAKELQYVPPEFRKMVVRELKIKRVLH